MFHKFVRAFRLTDAETFKERLASGHITVTELDSDGLCVIFSAETPGALEFLVANGAKLESRSPLKHETPLFRAVLLGRAPMLILKFIELGAKVDVLTTQGENIWHALARSNCPVQVWQEIAQLTLKGIDEPNYAGFTPLKIAIEKQLSNNAEHLLNFGAKLDEKLTSEHPLCYALELESKVYTLLSKRWIRMEIARCQSRQIHSERWMAISHGSNGKPKAFAIKADNDSDSTLPASESQEDWGWGYETD